MLLKSLEREREVRESKGTIECNALLKNKRARKRMSQTKVRIPNQKEKQKMIVSPPQHSPAKGVKNFEKSSTKFVNTSDAESLKMHNNKNTSLFVRALERSRRRNTIEFTYLDCKNSVRLLSP
jgi:hypothetical protein